MISILIVDDQNIIRQGLSMLLKSSPKFKIVGTAKDGYSAIEQVKSLRPDVVLMDIEMPNMSGITATQTISQQFPLTKVLILSSHEKQECIVRALQAGAQGYLLKDTSTENLEQAICLVYQGQSQIQSKLLKELLAQLSNTDSLTLKTSNELVSVGQKSMTNKSELFSETNNQSHNNHYHHNNQQYLPVLDIDQTKVNDLDKGLKSALEVAKLPPVLLDKLEKQDCSEEQNSDRQASTMQDIEATSVNKNWRTVIKKKGISLKFFRWWWLSGLVIIPLLLLSAKTFVYSQQNKTSPSVVAPTEAVPKAVAALGYLEPQGEVIEVSAPAFAEGTRVEQLLVKRGERVKKGQTVAILDNRDRLKAALDKAEKEVALAQNRLDQVKAGAKNGDIFAQTAKFQGIKAELNGQINIQQAMIADLKAQQQGETTAQQATVQRLEAELTNANKECQRYESLYRDGAISSSKKDSVCLQQTTSKERLAEAEANLIRIGNTSNQQISQAQANLERTKNTLSNQANEAEGNLKALSEVRFVDVNVAQTELEIARSAVTEAQANLALATVKSPTDGQILKINTWSGEIVNNSEGIVEIGNTENMYVVAEVYETDIDRVRVGQTAAITSGGVTKELTGTVDDIGLEIGTKDVLDTDPVADADARVVEVKINLKPEDSKQVANLTNLQVNVIIDTSQ